MTLEEFRKKIEVDNVSYYRVGNIINDMLEYDSHTADEYRTMLQIVRDKLLGLTTDTEFLQRKLDECRTMEAIGNFAKDKKFEKYYERGIPVSTMITARLNEISLEKERKRSFFHKILNLFKS